jgi:hypothetical protein
MLIERKFGNGVNDGARHHMLAMLHGSREGLAKNRLAFFAGHI